MEHLPYPDNSPHRPLKVHCSIPRSEIVDCSHGTQNAGSFIGRWAPRTTVPQLSEQNLKKTVRELQRWLYFGLISWSIDYPVGVHEFSREHSIDSTSLPQLLRSKQDQIQTNKRFEEVLQSVERELRRFTAAIDRLWINNDALRYKVQCVILSIRILLDLLWRTRRNCPEYAALKFMRHHEKYENPYPSPGINCDVLRRRMRTQDGWCRAMVSQILTSNTASTAYYLSSIPRARGDNIALHVDCSDSECRLNIDEDHYQQSHSSTCQHTGCRMVETPLDEVLDIIKQGGIPLMKLVGDTLEVRKAEFNVDYIAITHVWSGGLGNPERNAMWLCQLKEIMSLQRLSREVIASHNPPRGPESILPGVWNVIMDPSKLQSNRPLEWIWIDTLCVPRTANKTDETYMNFVWDRRQDSINRMTQTYAAASSVILLDTELQNFNFRTTQKSGNNDEDILAAFARTLCSGWMTRCWTYQEAAMASELPVQHKDGPFVLSIARAKVMRRNQELLQQCSYKQIDDMMDEMSAWFSRLPGTRDDQRFKARKVISQSSPEVFTRIWNDLGARTTSRPIDRIQIFSLLVDIAPTNLLSLPKNIRLKAIIKAQPNLPLALLFQRPLTDEQLLEVERQRRDEERADRDRGVLIQLSPEDETYPLPTRIQNESLPCQLGWMRRDEIGGKYVYFNTELMDEGSTIPSLFLLGNVIFRHGLTYKIHDRTSNCHFDICFGSRRDCSLASRSDQVLLMVSSEMRRDDFLAASLHEFRAVLLCPRDSEDHVGLGRTGRPNSIQRFQRLCSVLCNSFEVEVSSCQGPTQIFEAVRQEWDNDCEYRIDCDLSKVDDLPSHRITGFAPPAFTMFNLSSAKTPLLLAYYLIFLALTAPAAFTHGPGTFPPGFFALIAFVFIMRILVFVWNSFTLGPKANAIIFNDWVNSLFSKKDVPPTIDRSRHHTGVYIHMTMAYTLVFGGFCALFVVLGGLFFHERNARWLIPLGVAGLLELLLRYAAEVFYPRSRVLRNLIGPGTLAGLPDYAGLYENHFAESRLTRWVRGLSM